MEGSSAQCTKCHNFGTGPGASVGPPLREVAGRLTREQLLEALVDPSARIAPGFGAVQVTLKNGQGVFGTLREETNAYIVVDAGTAPRRIMEQEGSRYSEFETARRCLDSWRTLRKTG